MLTLKSPAKINLFLRILSKRPDGFHELASLFQAIDICDTLQISLASREQLTCTDSKLPTDSSNLILKAADLFRRKTGLTFGVNVHLTKNIPVEAGLGGGSSNAATTVWALNKLTQQNIPLEQLASWSSEIGSDVPFFLSTGTAYCTGRGEVLQPLSALPAQSLWIVKPPRGLSTKEIYGKLQLKKSLPRDPQECLEAFLAGNPSYFNDLEAPAFAACPELLQLKEQLYQVGFTTVLMSGSGSSFFCIGRATPPRLPGFFCQQSAFLNRAPEMWY